MDLLDLSKKAPNDLKTLILRPGHFYPSNPQDALELRSGVARFMETAIGQFSYSTSFGIRAQDLGRVAVAVAKGGEGIVGEGEQEELFRNTKIREIASALNAKEK